MIPPNERVAACCAECRFIAKSLRGICLRYGAIVQFDHICDDFEWPITGEVAVPEDNGGSAH